MKKSEDSRKQNDLIRAKVPDRYEYIINPELSPYDMYKRAKERDAAEYEARQKGKTDADAAKVTPQQVKQLEVQIKKIVENALNDKKV